jgi:Ras family protein
VSVEEGKELAQQWQCPTIETSAKHDENVCKSIATITTTIIIIIIIIIITCFSLAKIFDLLIAQIEKANKPPTEEKGGCIIA